jgi:nucleoid-associated protein YejK
MENHTQMLQIKQCIVHRIDPRQLNAPMLSSAPILLSTETNRFLRNLINVNQGHKYAQNAIFIKTEEGINPLQNTANELLSNSTMFVPHSQEIARQLFGAMQYDMRITPGDLIICTYDEGEEKHWLALMKIAPQEGYMAELQSGDNQLHIAFRRIGQIVLTGEAQKSAFIADINTRKSLGYDLRVLDLQTTGYGMRRQVASYFVHDFLHCEVGLNRREKTSAFILGSYEWLIKKQSEWPQKDLERFRERVLQVVQNNLIDLSEFAEGVIIDPSERDEYLEYMLKQQRLDELTFEPDPSARDQLTRFTEIVADDGIRIRVPTRILEKGEIIQISAQDAIGQHTITIRTNNVQIKK